MSKTRKRMLLSSLVMLIVAAMALASVTYAWFTTSKSATVTNIQFTAKAAEGIQLSATGANGTFRGTLTSGDIAAATAAQGNYFDENGTLIPVSTVGAVSGGQMAIFKGTIDENNKLDSIDVSGVAPTSTEMNFYKFNIYIKNMGATAATVKLDSTSTTVTAGSGATGIEYAARVAFIDQGEGVSATGGTAATIWEPNKTGNSAEAAAHRDTTYVTQGLNAVATDLDTANKAIGDAEPYYVATSSVANQPTVADASAITVCTVQPSAIEKITVYIWIEGQDIDCGNQESGGSVITNLKFTTEG